MTCLRLRPSIWTTCIASLFILAAQAFRFPSPLQDAVTGDFLPGYSLRIPLGHLVLTPLSAWADVITYNSARQDIVLVAYLLLGYWVIRATYLMSVVAPAKAGAQENVSKKLLLDSGFRRNDEFKKAGAATLRVLAREAGLYLLYLLAVVFFLAWAILGPRSTAFLQLSDTDLLAIDFHSHTNHSWDGRRIFPPFTPEANMRWHKDAGFGAAFITDHNTASGARRAFEISMANYRHTGYRSLMGEEVSLHDAHIGALGASQTIDNHFYDRDMAGLRRFLGDCEKVYGVLPTLNLPEYWVHYWNNLEDLIGWGARGIEIVNAVPKALDFPEDKRKRVIELARERGLFLTGVSDNHGWGRANYVWNVMRIPGHVTMGPEELQRAVLEKLRDDKFNAVSVVVRVKHPPASGAMMALDPFLSLWAFFRTCSWSQSLMTLFWIWCIALCAVPKTK